MRTRAYKTGFTLVEIVAVIAIIAILVSMIIRISKRIGDHAKERLCRVNIALIVNALEQFRDFGYEYKDTTTYAGLTFPLDCNDYDITASVFPCLNVQDTLHNALYSSVSTDPPVININGAHDKKFSGSEVLYFILSQVPDCRETLNKIDKSLLTDNGANNGIPITITIGASPPVPFTRIIDPWGTTLRYDYYPECVNYAGPMLYKDYRNSAKKTFPVITSAGPDKKFDTADDITNIK
jgi:prepilin-type N-terminal cleavage/methylation domain-containing protein